MAEQDEPPAAKRARLGDPAAAAMPEAAAAMPAHVKPHVKWLSPDVEARCCPGGERGNGVFARVGMPAGRMWKDHPICVPVAPPYLRGYPTPRGAQGTALGADASGAHGRIDAAAASRRLPDLTGLDELMEAVSSDSRFAELLHGDGRNPWAMSFVARHVEMQDTTEEELPEWAARLGVHAAAYNVLAGQIQSQVMREESGNGLVLLPHIRLTNHACDPNTEIAYAPELEPQVCSCGLGHFVLRALRDIPAGEELTYSYVGGLKGADQLDERRQRLRRSAISGVAADLTLTSNLMNATFDPAGNLVGLWDKALDKPHTFAGDGWSFDVGNLPFPTGAAVQKDKQVKSSANCRPLEKPPPMTTIDQCALFCLTVKECKAFTAKFDDWVTWGRPRMECNLFPCDEFADVAPDQNTSAGLRPAAAPKELTAAECSGVTVKSPSSSTVEAMHSGCQGFKVNVTYELAPEWHFVVKHLAICLEATDGTCDAAAGFSVRHVDVWPGLQMDPALTLEAMAINPFSRSDHFGATMPRGSDQTASFWRNSGADKVGVFATVQNSFFETDEGLRPFQWATCSDTPGWNNKAGFGCDGYVTNNWCAAGGPVPGKEWAIGPVYNYPENNCCVCGKAGEKARWSSLNYGVWQLDAALTKTSNMHLAAPYDTLNVQGKTGKGGSDVALLQGMASAGDVNIEVSLIEGMTTTLPAPAPLPGGFAGIVFGATGSAATATASATVDGYAAVVSLDKTKGLQTARFLQLAGALEDAASNTTVLKEANITADSDKPIRLTVRVAGSTASLLIDGAVVLQLTLPSAANGGHVGLVVLAQDASFHGFKSTAALAATPSLKLGSTLLQGHYSPMMTQAASLGAWHQADAGVVGVTRLTGYELPENGVDRGEAQAFTSCVEHFLMDNEMRKEGAVRLQVAWDSNEYQLDMAVQKDREQYKRLIQRVADLGIKFMIHEPRNTAVSSRFDHTDNWWWEMVLWFQLGIGIRNGTWSPGRDPIPPTTQEMLDFFKSVKVEPIAYVYPTLAWSGPGSDEWLYESPSRQPGDGMCASMASPKLQDYLIKTMTDFMNVTGGAGFAWDYGIQGDTRVGSLYQEVRGWTRILAALRKAKPDMAMDHRQIAHSFNAWYHLAGSYSEPIAGDENPESYGAALASLSTDHILADNLRLTNYRYRLQLLPNDRIPGFMFHQTERHFNNGTGDDSLGRPGDKIDSNGQALWKPDIIPGPDGNYSGVTYGNSVVTQDWHLRDFDYLGYRYSVLSTIGTAGRNLVVANVPARDMEEYNKFPKEDMTWIKKWFDWADTHGETLKNTMPLQGFEWPRLGRVDGTVATAGEEGFVFLYNPSPDAANASLLFDSSMDLADPNGSWMLAEIYPNEAGVPLGAWRFGASVPVSVPGGSVRILQLSKWDVTSANPVAFNIACESITLDEKSVTITNASALAGSKVPVVVRLPASATATALVVNGKTFPGTSVTCALKEKCISADVTFAGDASLRYNAIAAPAPTTLSDNYNAHVTVTTAMKTQLAERQAKYNISWVEDDKDASWLIPSRLLLYIYVARPTPALPTPKVKIDGKNVAVARQYNSRGNHAIVPPGGGAVAGNTAKTFLGWYVDCSGLTPDASHGVAISFGWDDEQHAEHPFSGIYWNNIQDALSKDVVAY